MWFSAYLPLPLCLSAGPAGGWGGGGGGGGGGVGGGGEEVGGWGAGTQHSEKGKRRWQVEVRAEQFSTVGVEVRREALGVEGGAEARVGITVVKETVILPPQAWTVPTILHGSLLSISPNRRKSFE